MCGARNVQVHSADEARLLRSIAKYLRLTERPNNTISLPEIKKAASQWSNHNWPSAKSSHAKLSREYFIPKICASFVRDANSDTRFSRAIATSKPPADKY